MPPLDALNHSFEDLAHSLRVLLEADYHANRAGLLFTDRAEAVGNIETALSSVLNAFHSLYDAVKKQFPDQLIDWYGTGPLATVLALRNARHHNKANRIRTLYTYHVQEAARPDGMEQYVLIDFSSPEEGADTFDVYLSWADIDQLLRLPRTDSRLADKSVVEIRNYLGSEKFATYAAKYDLPLSRVFLNVVPLFVNAAATIVPLIRPNITCHSTESETFSQHFCTVEPADMTDPEVNCGPFVLPS